MTLFSNYTNFGTIALLILGLTLFALLCPWRNLPTNLDTLLKSLWRLSGPVAVTWAIFVLLLIGTTAYAILLLVNHLGTVGANTDHLRQIILAIPVLIAALAGLIALPVTLIRLHYTRRQTLAEEEGLITDRINAAVLGLGAEKTVKDTVNGQVLERTEPNIKVRIGAILALERIAKKNLDVHVQIMELLCAYIRENANIPRDNQRELLSLEASMSLKYSNNENAEVSKIIEFERLPEISASGQDIQTAVNVLGRRPTHAIDEEKRVNFKIDLSDCFFAFISFSGDFNHAQFQDTFIVSSTFEKTKLNRTIFRWCNFHDVFFNRISANGAYLQQTHIAVSRIIDFCEVKEAWFDVTYFTANDFEDVDISDSMFVECRYQSTELPNCVRDNTRFIKCSIVRRTTER